MWLQSGPILFGRAQLQGPGQWDKDNIAGTFPDWRKQLDSNHSESWIPLSLKRGHLDEQANYQWTKYLFLQLNGDWTKDTCVHKLKVYFTCWVGFTQKWNFEITYSPSWHSKPVYLSFLCRRQKKNANQTVLVTTDFQCNRQDQWVISDILDIAYILRLFTSAYLLEEVRSPFKFFEVYTDGSLKNNRCSPLSSGCKIFLQSLLLKECLFWWLWITKRGMYHTLFYSVRERRVLLCRDGGLL